MKELDLAVVAYAAKRNANGMDIENHQEALRDALGTKRKFSPSELAKAAQAYESRRCPSRWDGPPWGQCGIKNHRAAIEAALAVIS